MTDFLSGLMEGYAGGRDAALRRQSQKLSIESQQFELDQAKQKAASEKQFQQDELGAIDDNDKAVKALLDTNALSAQHKEVLEAQQNMSLLSTLFHAAVKSGDHAEADKLFQQYNVQQSRIASVQKDRVAADAKAATLGASLAQSVLDAPPKEQRDAFERAKEAHRASMLFDDDPKTPFSGEWDDHKTPAALRQVAHNGLTAAQDMTLKLRAQQQKDVQARWAAGHALAVSKFNASEAHFTTTLNRLNAAGKVREAQALTKNATFTATPQREKDIAVAISDSGALGASDAKRVAPLVIERASQLKQQAALSGEPMADGEAQAQAITELTDPDTGVVTSVDYGGFYDAGLKLDESKVLKFQKDFSSKRRPAQASTGGSPSRPAPSAAQAYTVEHPATPKSKEDFDKLPSGSYYVDQQGNVRGPKK